MSFDWCCLGTLTSSSCVLCSEAAIDQNMHLSRSQPLNAVGKEYCLLEGSCPQETDDRQCLQSKADCSPTIGMKNDKRVYVM